MRFFFPNGYMEKINSVINFPKIGLNLKPFVQIY